MKQETLLALIQDILSNQNIRIHEFTCYQDSFVLAEFFASIGMKLMCQFAKPIPNMQVNLDCIKRAAKTHPVVLGFHFLETCTFTRHSNRINRHGSYKYVTYYYHWEFTTKFRLYCKTKESTIELFRKEGSTEIVTTSNKYPYPSRRNIEKEVLATLFFQFDDNIQIDKTNKKFYTAINNPEIQKILTFFNEFGVWAQSALMHLVKLGVKIFPDSQNTFNLFKKHFDFQIFEDAMISKFIHENDNNSSTNPLNPTESSKICDTIINLIQSKKDHWGLQIDSHFDEQKEKLFHFSRNLCFIYTIAFNI